MPHDHAYSARLVAGGPGLQKFSGFDLTVR
jgi:hypothetical protein